MENKQLLDIAKKAALIASNFLKKSHDSKEVIHDIVRDVKIKGDKESEKLIIDFLTKQTFFSVISEESGFIPNKNENYTWIIDPIDGTLNYSRNIPFSAISIALWNNKNPILGVIKDLNSNDIYSGIVGDGAWLNNKRIKVSFKKNISDSIIATGFPVSSDFSENNLNTLLDFLQKYKKVRLFGAASLSLAYYSCGKVDSYYEKNIKLWDAAAGIAIAKSAGGDIEFTDYNKDFVLSVNAKTNLDEV